MSMLLDKLNGIKAKQNTVDELLKLGYFLKTSDGNIKVNNVILNTIYENKAQIGIGIHKNVGDVVIDHCHNGIKEFLIIESGSVLLKIEGNLRIMRVADCAVIPEGVEHSVTALEDNTRVIYICIPPEKAYSKKESLCQK